MIIGVASWYESQKNQNFFVKAFQIMTAEKNQNVIDQAEIQMVSNIFD